ncbi:hypothetical protein [Desulfocicer niacini]
MTQMLPNGVNISRQEDLWSTSAAVVRMKNKKLEWIQAGDAVIILVYINPPPRRFLLNL